MPFHKDVLLSTEQLRSCPMSLNPCCNPSTWMTCVLVGSREPQGLITDYLRVASILIGRRAPTAEPSDTCWCHLKPTCASCKQRKFWGIVGAPLVGCIMMPIVVGMLCKVVHHPPASWDLRNPSCDGKHVPTSTAISLSLAASSSCFDCDLSQLWFLTPYCHIWPCISRF